MLLFFHLPALTRTLLISFITLLTLIGIMTRPFKWNEAMFALAGAGLLLITGLIVPANAIATLLGEWNTVLFFLGMMGLSALAEAAGFFDWLAALAARLAGGSSRRLFLNVFLLGSLISMILSNDATALILTPIGPKSVGHVARFVLDHAPCPVLLVHPLSRDHFPLQR
jgi:arsenical pump membrane protein